MQLMGYTERACYIYNVLWLLLKKKEEKYKEGLELKEHHGLTCACTNQTRTVRKYLWL